jgi:hypothetical protein
MPRPHNARAPRSRHCCRASASSFADLPRAGLELASQRDQPENGESSAAGLTEHGWRATVDVMRVRLQKTHRDRHVMEVQSDHGTTLRRELETRSTLRHDLMHWALERAAALRDSFFGRLARGDDPDQDRAAMTVPVQGRPAAELHATEVLVGMLQGAAARGVEPAAFVGFAGEMLALQGHRLPAFVTPELVRTVLAHYRQLVGQWDSLRHGGVLELEGAFD